MITLERYLVRQIMAAGSLSLLVLLGVVVALFFTELLGDAAGGRLPGRLILSLLALRLPEALILVTPLAVMTGVLLAVGAMGQLSELAAMRAGGLAPGALTRAVGRVVLVWALLLAGVTGWLSPLAERASDALLADAARSAVRAGLSPGEFSSLAGGDIVVYVAGIGEPAGTLEDVFIRRRLEAGTEVTTARRGAFRADAETGERFLTLYEGAQVTQDEQGGLVRRLSFARNDIRLPEISRADSEVGWAATMLPALVAADADGAAVELQWRLAPPLAVVLLAVLALPLAVVDPRQGRHGRIVIALVIYLAYSNAIHLCLRSMQQARLPQEVGLWPVHAVVLVLAVWLWAGLRRKW